MICKYFLPFHGFPLHSLDMFFECTNVLNFDVVQFIYFFLFLPVLLVLYPRNHCQIQTHEAFPICFLLSVFLVLALMFRSLIHFKLIFCIWCKVRAQLHSFACEYSVFLAPFAEQIWNTLQISMSYLCRGHAHLLYIIPILVYVLPK